MKTVQTALCSVVLILAAALKIWIFPFYFGDLAVCDLLWVTSICFVFFYRLPGVIPVAAGLAILCDLWQSPYAGYTALPLTLLLTAAFYLTGDLNNRQFWIYPLLAMTGQLALVMIGAGGSVLVGLPPALALRGSSLLAALPEAAVWSLLIYLAMKFLSHRHMLPRPVNTSTFRMTSFRKFKI